MTNANNPAVTRRLAAIVIADVVGYTRLMERDDTGTFARLRSIRDEVVDPAIVSHDGRIVKTAGDGLLAEFPSALAALRASVQIQREMAKRNEGVATNERIDYRIGVNLGDIMVDGSDIVGDGVNVASRLESLAEPGGICVSRSVREQVHGQMAVSFEDIGEQQVKNIERPIHVYRVVGGEVGALAGGAVLARRRRDIWAGNWRALAVVVVIAAAAVIAWLAHTSKNSDGTASGPPALSVAVLPLAVSGGAPEAAAAGASLSRDLAAQLARTDVAIRVVLATTTHTGAGVRSAHQIAEEANVRYVLGGELHDPQGAPEIRLSLTDGVSGAQVWTEATLLAGNATTRERKQALRATMEHLRSRLLAVEAQRIATRRDGESSAIEDVLRANSLSQGTKTLDLLRRQETLFEQALRKDPNSVPALLGLWETFEMQLDLDAHVDRDRLVGRMDDVTSRAVSLNPDGPETWAARGGALMYAGRWEAALEAIDRAIQLDPESAWLLTIRAWMMSNSGRPAEALALLARSAVMDPRPSGQQMRVECEARLLLGQYREAAAACEKARGRGYDELDVAYFLAAAYGHLGATDRAASESAKLLRGSPGFSIDVLRAKKFSVQHEYVQMAEHHLYSGLRKAGIPEK